MTTEATPRGKKKLLIVAILLVVIVSAIGYFFYSINIDPVVSFPAPKPLPSPNARDFYLAAAKLQVQSFTNPLTERTIYTYDIVNYVRGRSIIPKPGSTDPPPSLAEMQFLVAKNAPAFAKVRQGFAYEYGSSPLRADPARYDEIQNLRDLAYAMQADAALQCAAGEWDVAVERYVDFIEFGTDIYHGLPSNVPLGGIRMLGGPNVWFTLDHVSGFEARRAAHRLEKIAGQRTTLTEILQERKRETQAEMIKLFRNPNWRTEFGSSLSYEGELARDHFMLRFVSKRAAMRNFTRYIDDLIANVNEANPLKTRLPPPLGDALSRSITTDFKPFFFNYTRQETWHNMLLVSFALRAYRAEHGKYPANLNELTPDYLKAIPADLFSTDPLKYKASAKSYTLYSVGPDGKDDGGTPSIDGKDGAPKANVRLNLMSTGDIVAGVNIY